MDCNFQTSTMKFTVISIASVFAVALAISSVQGAPVEYSQMEERAFPQGTFQGHDYSGGKRPAAAPNTDGAVFGSSPRTPLNRVNPHNTPNDRIHVQTDITQQSDPAHLNPLKPGMFGPNQGEVTTNIKGGKRSVYDATF